jgi:hypothetical protein
MDEIKDLLLRSFDEELSAKDSLKLRKALSESEDLRKEKKAIEEMRNILAADTARFNEGFADRVMEKLDAEESQPVIPLYTVFKRMAISGVAAIIVFLITIYFMDGALNLDAIQGLADYTPGDDELSLFTNNNP